MVPKAGLDKKGRFNCQDWKDTLDDNKKNEKLFFFERNGYLCTA